MNLSNDFLREFKDKIDWRGFSYSHYNLSISFIEEFKDKIEWMNILYRNKLNEQFVRRHLTDLKKGYSFWSDVSSHVELSEQFIREYADKINWEYISKYQKLSEQFIEEFKDEVHWENIIIKQSLNEQFIKKHWKKISIHLNSGWKWREMLKKQKLGRRFMREHAKEIPWYDVKRDLEYIEANGGEKYASRLNKEFVNKMIVKTYEKDSLNLTKLNYNW